jgi:hypothetical protein
MPKIGGIEFFSRIKKEDNKVKFVSSQHQSLSLPIVKICSKTVTRNPRAKMKQEE